MYDRYPQNLSNTSNTELTCLSMLFILQLTSTGRKVANSANNDFKEVEYCLFDGGEDREQCDLGFMTIFLIFAMQGDCFLWNNSVDSL